MCVGVWGIRGVRSGEDELWVSGLGIAMTTAGAEGADLWEGESREPMSSILDTLLWGCRGTPRYVESSGQLDTGIRMALATVPSSLPCPADSSSSGTQ